VLRLQLKATDTQENVTILINEIQSTQIGNKTFLFYTNVISKLRRLYVKKHQGYHFFKIFFPIIPMGAKRYSCPIRLVPTYILRATDIRLLGKFQPDSF